jgi:hypothetical protein
VGHLGGCYVGHDDDTSELGRGTCEEKRQLTQQRVYGDHDGLKRREE